MPTNNGKKTTQRATKKAQSTNTTASKVAAPGKAEVKPAALKLDDGVLLNVRSNVYGGLVYINSRTGDKYEWNEFGDVQQLTAGDLRAMKGTQRSFFQNQWIVIDGIADSGYENVTQEDIYKALMVSQYYSDLVDLENFEDIFKMTSVDELRYLISKMSDGCRLNLVVAANTAIENGTLDSMRTIQALEECLGCELRKK